jgi:excisionase family DNA binding protein
VTDRLLKAEEVAALLNVPKTWPLEQARVDAIPHVRIGRYVRFRREAVLTWVAGLESGGGRVYGKHRPRIGA